MARTLAPTLAGIVHEVRAAPWGKRAARELRALLAVARAAEDLRARHKPADMDREEFLGPLHVHLNLHDGAWEATLHRALARLRGRDPGRGRGE